MPGDNGQGSTVDPSGVALATLMAEHTPLLASILAELRGSVLETAVGDVLFRQMTLDQFPVAGRKRIIAYRTGAGSDSTPVGTGTYVAPVNGLIVVANEGRLGGTIVNTGATAVTLYLTARPVPVVGTPAVWLGPGGGSWDFRLGNLVWCGNVSAVCASGSSTVTIAEV